jgi:gas vesicle protein
MEKKKSKNVKQTSPKKTSGAKKAVAVGAGAAILGAAAYLLLGPQGKKNRKAVKDWSVKMKKEVALELKKVKSATKPTYDKIVDKIQKKYAILKEVDNDELKNLSQEIKKFWTEIEKKAKADLPKSKTKKKS